MAPTFLGGSDGPRAVGTLSASGVVGFVCAGDSGSGSCEAHRGKRNRVRHDCQRAHGNQRQGDADLHQSRSPLPESGLHSAHLGRRSRARGQGAGIGKNLRGWSDHRVSRFAGDRPTGCEELERPEIARNHDPGIAPDKNTLSPPCLWTQELVRRTASAVSISRETELHVSPSWH